MLSIKTLLTHTPTNSTVSIQGWVRNKRKSKNVIFITLQDGSSFTPLQIVVNPTDIKEVLLKQITIGASLAVKGKVVSSLGQKQKKELQAIEIKLLGKASKAYPLQPKHHTLAFLRSIEHLRMRTNTFSAVFRIRHALAHAIHAFLHKEGFYWLHTPIITSIDAEGAGEVFSVITKVAGKEKMDSFFGKAVSLTVSGQLAGEAGAMGLGKIYTFGPTFRAENSNTPRHLAEFWMIEPEMAFYNLAQATDLAIALITHAIQYVLIHCTEEITFLEKRTLDQTKKKGQIPKKPLRAFLQGILEKGFTHITYTEAIDLLKKVTDEKPNKFTFPVKVWGGALQAEHEHYLTDHFQGGVVVTNYPKEIKAFYMRQNEDGKTVAAMDILLPSIGEIIGGSQREERLNYLEAAIDAINLDKKDMDWYLDTRRFGTVPHSGFGIGFERLVLFITGMENIRDVIPFPRTPGHAMC